jgi:hypothetical protein
VARAPRDALISGARLLNALNAVKRSQKKLHEVTAMTMYSFTSLESYEASINIIQDTCSFNDPPKLLGDLVVEAVQCTLHCLLSFRWRLESK